jgi:hypothetical protein
MDEEEFTRPHAAAGNAPGVTRTRGQQFRKLLLYPSELRGLFLRTSPQAAWEDAAPVVL